ncbi:MAG: nuclear transport factor 2 family protein [Acidobacteriota bacterium]|nr:nuclear transport factor 2 family protein [Acidobacteriota bacterium]
MLTSLLLLTMLPAVAVIEAAQSANPTDDPTAEIIALEKAMLDRWGTGDTYSFIELAAPEITYFDPSLEKRLDGREAFEKFLAPLKGTFRIPRYEIIDPKVQVYGEAAVLSYNMVDYDEKEINAFRMNVTEVYARRDGRWGLVHSHFSITKPQIK